MKSQTVTCIVCTANGFIVDDYGPFAATVNDASILSYLLDHSNLKELFTKSFLLIFHFMIET